MIASVTQSKWGGVIVGVVFALSGFFLKKYHSRQIAYLFLGIAVVNLFLELVILPIGVGSLVFGIAYVLMGVQAVDHTKRLQQSN